MADKTGKHSSEVKKAGGEPFLPEDVARGIQYIAHGELTNLWHTLPGSPKDDEVLTDAKAVIDGLVRKAGRIPKESLKEGKLALHEPYDALMSETDDSKLKVLCAKYQPVEGEDAGSRQKKDAFRKLLEAYDKHTNTHEIVDEIVKAEAVRQLIEKRGFHIYKKDHNAYLSNQAIDVVIYHVLDEDARTYMGNLLRKEAEDAPFHFDKEQALDLGVDLRLQAKRDAARFMHELLHKARLMSTAKAQRTMQDIEHPEPILAGMAPSTDIVELYKRYSPQSREVPDDVKEEFHKVYAEQSAAALEIINVMTKGKGRSLQ